MLKLFKNRKVRASATNTSIVSAGVPDSGFAFVNNSQGASAAISELSGRLDRALDKIEINGECLVRVTAAMSTPSTAFFQILVGFAENCQENHWMTNSGPS